MRAFITSGTVRAGGGKAKVTPELLELDILP